jgi:23S rRNA (cytosine1962-C5)-methyltransferase
MREGVLRLKRGREQRARTHPWIFKGDVADVTDVAAGTAVAVVDSGGRFVGRGFYNPRPALCCRIVTWDDEPLDAEFFRRRLGRALAWRPDDGGRPVPRRLVWSEGDGLPGLVVDRYPPAVVVQCSTLGMHGARPLIAAALRAHLGETPIFEADDEVAAEREGFAPARGWRDAPGPAGTVVDEGDAARPVRFTVTFGAGQKTGLYLDQRDNRVRLAPLARGRAMLDAFAYVGGFACHALVAGATRAVAIESSPEALATARANFELNGVAARTELIAANVFDELRRLERAGARFGLVVLDPPPFARSRAALEAADRGYKEINLRAMRLLEADGVLATFSCSHHVDEGRFESILRAAAADAGLAFRIAGPLGQSADHPALLGVPETRYLKGLLLQRIQE